MAKLRPFLAHGRQKPNVFITLELSKKQQNKEQKTLANFKRGGTLDLSD
jgi:hypothetical protein